MDDMILTAAVSFGQQHGTNPPRQQLLLLLNDFYNIALTIFILHKENLVYSLSAFLESIYLLSCWQVTFVPFALIRICI